MKNTKNKPREKNLKTYTIVNDNDGNDSFTVKAIDDNDAAFKALQELGWWVASN